jgi:hypothetical protein
LFSERILSRIDTNSSAYRRLKLVMDYWCALWFWPIDKANMLPTREAFLLEIQSIIEGGVIETPLIEKNQYVLNLGNVPVQQELDTYQERGYVNLEKLCRDYPRLALVQNLAERYRFHHWELEFTDLFAERGGFDLVVGNPPWIKVEWSEGSVLGDANPRFVFDKLSASALNQMRDTTLAQHPELRSEYLAEFEEAEATQNFLNGYQNYPMLRGIQTNLYKCFLPQAWYVGSPSGASGFLHPEGVYDDPKGGKLREQIYPRLQYHFQFQNGMNLFPYVAHREKFSVNVYGNTPRPLPTFEQINNLFAVSVVDTCYAHSGVGALEGIKDSNNNWNLNGHKRRIVQIDERTLSLFAALYDEPGTTAGQARLPVIHSQEIVTVLQKFANQPRRLGDLKDEYFSTEMWHETNAQKDGTIRRDTQFPKSTEQWVLSGPHFYVGNPTYKTPRRVCKEKGDYDPLDLKLLPDEYLPRTNYVPACDPVSYRNRTQEVSWNGEKQVIEYFRLIFRAMLGQPNEHTLFAAIAPKLCGHINGVRSYCFSESKTSLGILFGAYTCSLVFDFFVKTTGKTNLHQMLDTFPLVSGTQVDFLILLRALMLNCLTTHYADLWIQCWNPTFQEYEWAKTDPRLNNDHFRKLTPQWTRDCVLRTDFERRQALVEIDVLAAMALGLTCDELCAIYRIQFPVLCQNENDTWYDQYGRIAFTCSKGLPGVGLDRPQWEKESNLAKLETAGLEIKDEGGRMKDEFNSIKEMKRGTVKRTVVDDTIADYRYAYGTFRKDGVTYHCPCPDHPEPIEGPVERDITYVAPFTRCDREEDYRTVWTEFSRRVGAGNSKAWERSHA